jgi:hypothetical protein
MKLMVLLMLLLPPKKSGLMRSEQIVRKRKVTLAQNLSASNSKVYIMSLLNKYIQLYTEDFDRMP